MDIGGKIIYAKFEAIRWFGAFNQAPHKRGSSCTMHFYTWVLLLHGCLHHKTRIFVNLQTVICINSIQLQSHFQYKCTSLFLRWHILHIKCSFNILVTSFWPVVHPPKAVALCSIIRMFSRQRVLIYFKGDLWNENCLLVPILERPNSGELLCL